MSKTNQGPQLYECDECHKQESAAGGLPEGWFTWEFRIFARLQASDRLPRPFKTNSARMHRAINAHLCSVQCTHQWIGGDLEGVSIYLDSLEHCFEILEDQQARNSRVERPQVINEEGVGMPFEVDPDTGFIIGRK